MSDPVIHQPSHQFQKQLLWMRRHYGENIQSVLLRDSLSGFRGQKGIYKPSGSRYALWVRQTLSGIYPDEEPIVNPDGSWTYRYTPEWRKNKLDMNLDTNQSLLNCMEDHVPIGVFRQCPTGNKLSTYEVLGLAYIDQFDGTHFVLRSDPIDWVKQPTMETEVTKFQPFDSNVRELLSLRKERDRRFAVAVRYAYKERCSVCELSFRIGGELVGLDASHIIPVEKHGTSLDVRNGIFLCRNHHALFDSYAWTLDEDFRVVISNDKTFQKSASPNHILKLDGKQLPNLPQQKSSWPAPEAIKYRLQQFERKWK